MRPRKGAKVTPSLEEEEDDVLEVEDAEAEVAPVDVVVDGDVEGDVVDVADAEEEEEEGRIGVG